MTEINLYSEQTMSSREIAELTGKEHRNVLRDIDKLNEEYERMSLLRCEQREYLNTRNQKMPEYVLTKIQTFDLMTGYRTDLRIKVNRRWEELEMIEQNPDLLILRGYKAALNKIEALSEKIVEDKPKVAFAETVAASSGSMLIGDFCKTISKPEDGFIVGPIKGMAWFREKKILMTGPPIRNHNIPYQHPYVEKGFFEVTEAVISTAEIGFTPRTARITGKGQVHFAEKMRADSRFYKKGLKDQLSLFNN